MVRLTGRVLDFYLDDGQEADDGDIWLQSKLDTDGRTAVRGRRANNGYSGYFLGYLQAEGGRRCFLSWRALFPEFENGFLRQGDKRETVLRIGHCLKALREIDIEKAKGGWRFSEELVISQAIEQHWLDWRSPRRGLSREEAQAIADRRNIALSQVSKRQVTADDILNEPEPWWEKSAP